MTNFTARARALTKPSAISMFSQIGRRSGRIIAHDRNNAFRFSGSSVLPAYPGFIVMKNPQVGTMDTASPKKSNTPT